MQYHSALAQLLQNFFILAKKQTDYDKINMILDKIYAFPCNQPQQNILKAIVVSIKNYKPKDQITKDYQDYLATVAHFLKEKYKISNFDQSTVKDVRFIAVNEYNLLSQIINNVDFEI